MIVDTHAHFYDPSRPEGVPWPGKDNELLYRTVLPEHLKSEAEPMGVTGTVVVEASSWFDDNQWILDLAADEPYIVGFVGHLQPEIDEFADHVDRFASNPLFRGIRLGRTHVQNAEQLELASKLGQLVECDLELDLLVGATELPMAADLASEVPDLRIVLNHVAHVPIDAAIGWTQDDGTRKHRRAGTNVDDNLADPDRIAETYLQLYRQHRSTWAFEVALRPWIETW